MLFTLDCFVAWLGGFRFSQVCGVWRRRHGPSIITAQAGDRTEAQGGGERRCWRDSHGAEDRGRERGAAPNVAQPELGKASSPYCAYDWHHQQAQPELVVSWNLPTRELEH